MKSLPKIIPDNERAAVLAAPPADPLARFELVRRNFEQSGITVEVDEVSLRIVHDAMEGAMFAAQKAVDQVRELAGPNPGPIPQHLITVMLMGTGYFRTARDTLRILFKARNCRRRVAKISFSAGSAIATEISPE